VAEIDLGDTIGAGTAETTAALLRAYDARVGIVRGPAPVTLHLHDTFGKAAECVRAGLDAGVRSFDGSAGGLGGCPYAGTPERRAPGNISTEVLVRTVEGAGYETGVDVDALRRAGAYAAEIVAGSRGGA
jgi:hydroxymethylglutaryl-CoA lyase